MLSRGVWSIADRQHQINDSTYFSGANQRFRAPIRARLPPPGIRFGGQVRPTSHPLERPDATLPTAGDNHCGPCKPTRGGAFQLTSRPGSKRCGGAFQLTFQPGSKRCQRASTRRAGERCDATRCDALRNDIHVHRAQLLRWGLATPLGSRSAHVRSPCFWSSSNFVRCPPARLQAGGQRTYTALTASRGAASSAPRTCRARRARHVPARCRCAATFNPP